MSRSNIPETELFWSLVDKADRKFSRVRDLPSYGRNRNDSDFHKAFKIYTRLWKMQQENRQKLVEAGLKRWEIGEIASRIAQLYYGQYQRTSDSSFLSESFIFYEAILAREYFKDTSSQDSALANKQLRFLARFLLVCLLMSRREMVARLVSQLRSLVDECKKNFQETEFKEWKHVVQEIVRFLKVDTPIMNMRPLRYSFVYDCHPDSLPLVVSSEGKRGLRLRDAILSSYRYNEVKFTDLTLDTFMMLQCLEWEPRGSFSLTSVDIGQSGVGPNDINPLQDIRDPTLPPNPQKVILYRPALTHFLLVLATTCEDLPPDGIILIYVSASGKGTMIVPEPLNSGSITNIAEKVTGNFNDIASHMSSPPNILSNSSFWNMESHIFDHEGCMWMGSHQNGGSNCLYPCDLIPFTRRPLFLIVDSDSSHAFKAGGVIYGFPSMTDAPPKYDHMERCAILLHLTPTKFYVLTIHGAEKGETVAMLLSPSSQSLPIPSATDTVRCQNGSLFTMFLTAPVQAIFFLLGIPSSNINKEAYEKAEKLLSSSLNEWGLVLATSESLDPVWAEVLGDPFLRRLLLRFIYCRAVLALNRSTFGQEEFLPECLPHLPESVLPESATCQSAVMNLAELFNLTHNFIFSDGVVLPDSRADESSSIMKASDTRESHFSAENGN